MSGSELRHLPAVHAVRDVLDRLAPALGTPTARTQAVRAVLDEARSALLRNEVVAIDPEALARKAADRLSASRPHLRPVLNATGILLHTGLGRAPLALEAIEAMASVSQGYCNLEFELDSGTRGRRGAGVEPLLAALCGAEAALIVNNNAAATVLALRALARDREVILSRGELVEIGGSFRLPEIFEASGARLREVGTTNRTRLADYERAITPETAALMRVHPSNYRVVGFTESAPVAELADLARRRGLWMIDDIGSGRLDPDRPAGVAGEPTAAESLAAGSHLVLGSGDKLLGGPQCGLLVGVRECIGRLRDDPLMRAFRVDKLTLAALEATLRLALDPGSGRQRIPLWRMLAADPAGLQSRAERLARSWREASSLAAEAVAGESLLGGGSAPLWPLPTWLIRVGPPWPPGRDAASWAARLRAGEPPVVTRIRDGHVLFDLRTIDPAEDQALNAAVQALVTVL